MEQRRLCLIIGSQCQTRGELPFLPWGRGPLDVAQLPERHRTVLRLRELLIDEAIGGWGVVDVDGQSLPGLLLNPTEQEARHALRMALDQADQNDAVLLVYFLGHGGGQDRSTGHAQHLLEVWDTQVVDGEKPKQGWNPYGTVSRLVRGGQLSNVVGLVLMVDACGTSFSTDAIKRWSNPHGGLTSVFVGASSDHPAWDACFTHTLVNAIERGVSVHEHRRGFVPYLHASDFAAIARTKCQPQVPRMEGFDTENPDLWVTANQSYARTARKLGIDGRTANLILGLDHGRVPFASDMVRAALDVDCTVVLMGDAGSGKSTLAADLRLRHLVDAVVFASAVTTADELSDTLRGQLDLLPDFEESAELRRVNSGARWDNLDSWQRQVTEPLEEYLTTHHTTVRLVIDGLDQLEGRPASGPAWLMIRDLASRPELARVSLLVTTRTDPELANARIVKMPALDADTARQYLSGRHIQDSRQDELVDLASSNWLVLRLAADVDATGEAQAHPTLENLYSGILQRAHRDHGDAVEAALGALAVDGAGAHMPLEVLHASLEIANHHVNRRELMQLLGGSDLYPVVTRFRPGQTGELVGLFHQSLVEYVAAQPGALDARMAVVEHCRAWRSDGTGYALGSLASLLASIGATDELSALLHDPDFLAAKTHASGPASVFADFDLGTRNGVGDASTVEHEYRKLVHLVPRIADAGQLGANLRERIPLLRSGPWTPPATYLAPADGYPLPDAPHPDLQVLLDISLPYAVAWSSDGRLAVGGVFGTPVTVYDRDLTREPLTVPSQSTISRSCLAWSLDGTLAYGGHSGEVILVRPGGSEPRVVASHPEGGLISALAWSDEGDLAIGGSQGWLTVMRGAGTDQAALQILQAHGSESIESLAWSHDGQLAVAGSSVTTFAAGAAEGHQPEIPPGFDQAVAWSKDGQLAIGGNAGVGIWDGHAWTTTDSEMAVDVLSWSSQGRLAGARDDLGRRGGQVFVWDVASRTRVALWGHDGPIRSVSWSPDGALASASTDGVRVWRPGTRDSGAPVSLQYVGSVATSSTSIASAATDGIHCTSTAGRSWSLPPRGATSLAWMPDGDLAVAHDGSAEIWADPRGASRVLGGRVHAKHLDVSPDGTLAITSPSYALVWTWNPATMLVQELGIDGDVYEWREVGTEIPVSVNLRMGDHWLRADQSDGAVFPGPMLYSQFADRLQDSWSSVRGVTAAAWSCGGILATGHGNGDIRIWGALSESKRVARGRSSVWSIAWSPDDRFVAAAVGAEVLVWDTTMQTTRAVSARTVVKAVAWSDDGLLAMGDADGTVRVFLRPAEPEGESAIFALDAEVGPSALAWGPAHRTLVVGTAKGLALLEVHCRRDCVPASVSIAPGT